MSTAFLWQNALANAWVGDRGTAALPALSLANLSDPQPRVRTRWPGGAGVSVWFDMGASAEVACVALISTTLGSAGGTTLVRARLSDDPLFATAAWDTGVLDPPPTPMRTATSCSSTPPAPAGGSCWSRWRCGGGTDRRRAHRGRAAVALHPFVVAGGGGRGG